MEKKKKQSWRGSLIFNHQLKILPFRFLLSMHKKKMFLLTLLKKNKEKEKRESQSK